MQALPLETQSDLTSPPIAFAHDGFAIIGGARGRACIWDTECGDELQVLCHGGEPILRNFDPRSLNRFRRMPHWLSYGKLTYFFVFQQLNPIPRHFLLKMRTYFLLPQGRMKVKLVGLSCGIQLHDHMTLMVGKSFSPILKLLKLTRCSE